MKTQIWIAISVYVLLAILAKLLAIERDFYTILQILSVRLLEKTEISQALSRRNYESTGDPFRNQLLLFEL